MRGVLYPTGGKRLVNKAFQIFFFWGKGLGLEEAEWLRIILERTSPQQLKISS